MATINISDLHPVGSDLFYDSEGYMRDLTDSEFDHLSGGFSPLIYAGVLALESSGACAAAAGLVVGGVIGYTNA
ncbi:MAG: hypothetical protein RM049_05700 [Nostoc sp. DedQUE04]|uniref:hypothetical protein n=1 Tax=Nostoc sp. DedQUE04 TaxID=3075390 RepID=UPI002AD38771|nr:hypothetical protein [Nostoc sp. DedQUE04]MDZ8134785.1 hypothetical protein [Nostoc sp. DedQUE04]